MNIPFYAYGTSALSGTMSNAGPLAFPAEYQPQTQISIEQAENELNISASIHGVGINMIIVEEILRNTRHF